MDAGANGRGSEMKRTYDWTPAWEIKEDIKKWLDAGHTLMTRKHMRHSYPMYGFTVKREGLYHRGTSAPPVFESLDWTGFDVIPPTHED